MPRTQALLVSLVTGDSRSISRQIVDGVRLRIAKGELVSGAQLPSVRALAEQLSVNPNTVAKAYAELGQEGWLETRQGLGVFVAAPRQRLSDAERERRLDMAAQRFVQDVVGLGYTTDELVAHVRGELRGVAGRRIA
jgi:GntR family transcriptional regulator